MSWGGIVGAVLLMIMIIVIVKPVYSNMRGDIFLKIGGNTNKWSKNCYILNINRCLFQLYTVKELAQA